MSPQTWRSFLYIPAHVEKFVDKAAAGEADVVILDLEDAVPLEQKPRARGMLLLSAASLREAGKVVAVRINSDPVLLEGDIKAALGARADVLILPKVETPDFVRHVVNLAKAAGGIDVALVALIETPRGLLNAPNIAAADPWLAALSLGTEDFCLEMNAEPGWDSLLFPSQQVIIAAQSEGKIPLGYVGSIAQFRDIEAFDQVIRRSVKLGFRGGFAIHPNQIAPLNSAFSPSPSEIIQAREIIEAFEEAQRLGLGAVRLNGRMIDLPIVEKARRTVLRSNL